MSSTAAIATTDVPSVPQRGRASARLRLTVAAGAIGAVALLGTACQPTRSPQAAVKQYFGSQTTCANRIVQRESRWVPTAVSAGGGNIGLFQINKVHAGWISRELGYSYSSLTDPYRTAHTAKVIYNKAQAAYGDGWQPWRIGGKAIRGGGCPA